MREYYYQKLGTDIRSHLVLQGTARAEQGLKTLILAPSREVIFTYRDEIERVWGGLMQIQVGGFEDLERLLLPRISGQLVDQDTAVRMVHHVCRQHRQHEALALFSRGVEKEGLARLFYRQIKKIKRANQTPEEILIKATEHHASDPVSPMWQAVLAVYAWYQDMLQDLGLVDVDDVSMQAARVTGAAHALPLDFLVLDGFINLDPVQKDMLAAMLRLHPHLECMASIPFYTEATDGFLQGNIIHDLKSLGFSLNDPPVPFSEHEMAAADLAYHLFDPDAPVGEANSAVCIVDSPCLEDEVRQIMHRVRALLSRGHGSLEQIALVVRDQDVYQELLVRVAEELFVPLHVTPMNPLHTSPLIKDLLRSLHDIASGMQVVGAQSRLAMILGHAEEDPLQWLSTFWPENATPEEYSTILQEWLSRVCLSRQLARLHRENTVSDTYVFKELGSLQMLGKLLAGMEHSFAIIPDTDPISAASYVQMLQDEIEDRSVPDARPLGGVKVLDPDLLRGVSMDHVFCLGLNDGSIPRTGDQDLQALFGQDSRFVDLLPQQKSQWEMDREKIRFQLMCAAARKSLTLSYRTANEDGSYLLPSPFLQDAAEFLMTTLKPTRTMRDRFTFSLEEAASPREVFLWWAAHGGPGWHMAEAIPWQEWPDRVTIGNNVEHVREAFRIESLRFSPHPPDRYDGNLLGQVLLQQQKNYSFSASQLNQYRRCGFRYFASRILGLQVATDEEEINPLYLGSLYHGVLAEYYQKMPRQVDKDVLDACLKVKLEEMTAFRYNSLFLNAKETEVRDNLLMFIQEDYAYRTHFKETEGTELIPTYLEWSLEDEQTIPGFRFAASIDRVDLEMDGARPTGRFILYDYKTKNTQNLRDILKGEDIQLPLYVLLGTTAVKNILDTADVVCIGALSYSIIRKEKKGLFRDEWKKALGMSVKGIHANQWEALMTGFQERIVRMCGQIQAGYCVLPKRCPFQGNFQSYSCDFEPLCRYHPQRMAAKRREGR